MGIFALVMVSMDSIPWPRSIELTFLIAFFSLILGICKHKSRSPDFNDNPLADDPNITSDESLNFDVRDFSRCLNKPSLLFLSLALSKWLEIVLCSGLSNPFSISSDGKENLVSFTKNE